ncbi:MAG: DUF2567 domain-containing protein [Actinophytocola sp.]|nr:DUF2567 domain-containing protein [Actinophytocola sp.]
MLQRERPKVVIKADLLPSVTVASTIGMAGIPIGWLWAQLAPPRQAVITSDGKPTPVDMESWHSFDALVIFALLLLGAGLVLGTLTWLLRERRGPVVMLAAVAGSLLSGWLGMLMGRAFLGDEYAVSGRPKIGDVITLAPEISSSWVIIMQPLAVALVYAVLAAWNGRDDLGRRLA